GPGDVGVDIPRRRAGRARRHARAFAAGRREVAGIRAVECGTVDLAPGVAADQVVEQVDADWIRRGRALAHDAVATARRADVGAVAGDRVVDEPRYVATADV